MQDCHSGGERYSPTPASACTAPEQKFPSAYNFELVARPSTNALQPENMPLALVSNNSWAVASVADTNSVAETTARMGKSRRNRRSKTRAKFGMSVVATLSYRTASCIELANADIAACVVIWQRTANPAPRLWGCYRGLRAQASATTLPASVSTLAQYAAQASINLRRLSNKWPEA